MCFHVFSYVSNVFLLWSFDFQFCLLIFIAFKSCSLGFDWFFLFDWLGPMNREIARGHSSCGIWNPKATLYKQDRIPHWHPESEGDPMGNILDPTREIGFPP
jgi:hypothetical protein